MASVTMPGGVFSTAAGNKTTSALTVAASDLIVLFCYNTGRTTAQPPVPTDDNGGAAYTRISAVDATKNTSADSQWCFVRTTLLGSASATTFSFTQSGDSGGGMQVFRISGMTRTGASAVRQSAKADNQAAGTPSVTLPGAILTANPVLGSVLTTQTGTANTAAPTGWTEDQDAGYSTPSTGREVAHINSGETRTTVPWTAATTSAFCAVVVELDSSSSAVSANAVTATATGTALVSGKSVTPGTLGVATATGAALNVTAQTGKAVTAEVATATGAASNTTAKAAPTEQVATATGAAASASASLAAPLQAATATGAALNATVTVTSGTTATAEVATATGAALGSDTVIAPTTVTATATGNALGTDATVGATTQLPTATGTANNATVSAASTRDANAVTATATGAALGTDATVSPAALIATAMGSALNATATATGGSISTSAGLATAIGAAYNPTFSTVVVVPEPPPGTSIRAGGGRLRPKRPQRENEDWVVLIL
jgi:hypothetical protein